jgi:hypothetical protein
MAERSPLMWQPKEVVEVTNVSAQNVILELDSGPLRLDAGRTLRLTGSALRQAPVKALLDSGVIQAVPWKQKK